MIDRITIDAKLIGEYCTAALAFDYQERAEEVLEKLQSQPEITLGIVYDKDNAVFATYRHSQGNDVPSQFHGKSYHEFDKQFLHVWEPIIYQDMPYGTIYIKANKAYLNTTINSHLLVMLALFLTMFALTYILANILQKIISFPIVQLTRTTRKISENRDYSIRFDLKRKDEIGLLYRAFNNMLDVIQKRNNEIEFENWLKNGRVDLLEHLRGDQSLEIMGTNIIQFLGQYLGIQIASIYWADSNDQLILIGRYAINDNEKIPSTLQLGEGLIGQVALNKTPVQLSECPNNYFQISSSLGSACPNQILIYPFVKENKLKAIIELGALNRFNGNELTFLDQINESVTAAFQAVESRNKMQRLLKQTQTQADELKIREEELQQTNEVLAEKNCLLEEQKIHMEMRNNDLQIAQKAVEEKVKELEISNTFKSEFLANMSHELRTPLNSILLLSQHMYENESSHLTDDDIYSAKLIHKSGNDLLNLINDILDLSKIEAGRIHLNFEKIHIQNFAESMQQIFIPLAKEKGLTFTTHIAPNMPQKIYSDRQRIEQIIKNMLSNAIKFTHSGSVKLEVKRPSSNQSIASVLNQNALTPSKAIAFSVTDTGVGISKDKQQIIFEAFQQANGTTSRKYGGSGLGLSIAREFARLLGGVIRVESETNKGSTFTLFLPETNETDLEKIPENQVLQNLNTTDISSEEKPKIESFESESFEPEQTFGNINDDRDNINIEDNTVLIIEDDLNFAKLLYNKSHDHGFKALIADNGELGLKLAGIYYPNAVMLDIKLPDICGIQVLEQFKENPFTRHIPIHCISALDDDGAAKKLGVMSYLVKPVGQDDIDGIYFQLNKRLSKKVNNVLIVEDNLPHAQAIKSLIGNTDIQTDLVYSASEAIDRFTHNTYDCIIMDLGLPDMSGVELLKLVRQKEDVYQMPVIVYTGIEISAEEREILDDLAQITIIKGENASQRLIAEIAIFLHRVSSNLPEMQQQMLNIIHNNDMVFNDKTILIVDDDMRNVYSLKRIFSEKKIRTCIGKNGKEGIESLQNNPNIDLVLMDIMMPEMDGFEAIGHIRKIGQFEKLPIIAMTAKAMKGDRSRCIHAGANDYISKPIEIDRLISTLRVWLC